MACVIYGYKINTDKGLKCVEDQFFNGDMIKDGELNTQNAKTTELKLGIGYSIICPNKINNDVYLALSYTYISREKNQIMKKISYVDPAEVSAFTNWATNYIRGKYLCEMQYGMWLIIDESILTSNNIKDNNVINNNDPMDSSNKKTVLQVAIGDIIFINSVRCQIVEKFQSATGKHGKSKILLKYINRSNGKDGETVYNPEDVVYIPN